MANDYFTESAAPATGSSLLSATIRAEFTAIGDGFDKLIDLSANASKIPRVNSGGTAQEASNITDDGTKITLGSDAAIGGNLIVEQVAPDTLTTSQTLTAAAILKRIVVCAPASGSIAITLPTGTDLDAAFPSLSVDQAIDWYIINTDTGSFDVSLLASAGNTIVGSITVGNSPSSSAWTSRKTAANTFVTYRIA